MTDDANETLPPATPQPETPSPNSLSGKSKAFWMGVGIGSAALAAALMYARRPKKKK
jgi:hypothetical protein